MTVAARARAAGCRGSEAALIRTLIIVVVVVALVSSLGAPLVPAIAADRGVAPATAQWTLTVTLLTGAVACPVLGRLGDGRHRRRVILVTLAGVALGCALALPSWDFWVLLLGRALQGLGLGLMPLTMAVARDHLSAGRLRGAVSLLSITTVAGAGIGYPISGALAAAASIEASYAFGLAVSLAALTSAFLVLPDGGHLDRQRLDHLGAVLVGAGVAGLLVAVSEGDSWGWASSRVLGLLVASLLMLSIWAWHELHTRVPLIELRLLRRRAVLVANLTAVAAGAGIYLLMSTVSWLLQSAGDGGGSGFGQTALVASLAMVPFSVVSVATSFVVTRAFADADEGWLLPVGCVLFGLSMVGLATMRDDVWMVFVVMAIGGTGAGCTFAAMPRIIVAAVPRHEVGSAIGFNQVLRTIGYATGSAISAALLATYAGPSGSTLPAGYDAAAVIGMTVFGVAALAGAALAVVPRQRFTSVPDDLATPPDP